MTLPAATRATVEALVRTHRQRADPDVETCRVIGVQARPEWQGPQSFPVEGETVRVAPCRSVLEVRVELADRADPDEWLVLVTDRDERDLGLDVMARLARRRLQSIDTWTAVAAAFNARTVDPAVRRTPDLASALLEHRPPSGYPPVVGTVLDRDTAWTALAERVLGVDGLDRDPAHAVLEWLASGNAAVGLAAISDSLADGWWGWLETHIGPVARFGRALATAGRPADAIALGLCGRVVLNADDVETAKVHGRFEQVVGAKLDDGSLTAVVEAAERAAQPRDLARAEAALRELDAVPLAARSNVLPAGFTARLATAAAALVAALEEPALGGEASAAVQACRSHREAATHEARLDALQMAIRLARRLGLPQLEEPRSLAEAAVWFASDSAAVDLGRARVWRGESEPSLAAAYVKLDGLLLALREAENERFGVLLADWLQSSSSDPRLVAVEDVLDNVVAPLASHGPVLLVVMDGLSWPTWAELAADLPRLGWDEVISEHAGSRLVGVATVPSATTFSRTSLLRGELRTGTAKDESKGFAEALAGKASGAPLFHKADLVPAAGGTVAPVVVEAIADIKRRVVGVVVNEIDDALAGGMQADRRFRIPEIGPLMTCLEAARNAGRICVITSDHGHVVEYEGEYRSSGGRAERWRPASDGVGEGEILLRGRRVLAGDGKVVAPWTERVRYSAGKSAGYHGGATPQEMLVPIAVLAGRGQAIPGWRAAAPLVPTWWDDDAPQPALVAPRPNTADTLLDPRLAEPQWVETLLRNPLYAAQRERHSRVAVDDERARRVLACLASRGDRSTMGAVAQALEMPEHRARGVVSGLRRVLAVDGFDVLVVTEDDLSLDRSLLFQQFGLGGAASE